MVVVVVVVVVVLVVLVVVVVVVVVVSVVVAVIVVVADVVTVVVTVIVVFSHGQAIQGVLVVHSSVCSFVRLSATICYHGLLVFFSTSLMLISYFDGQINMPRSWPLDTEIAGGKT